MYILAVFYLLSVSLLSYGHNEEGHNIRWGIAPLAKGRLHENWAPSVMDTLKLRTGIEVTLASAADLEGFVENLVAGQYDVANCPTLIALYAMRYHHFIPLIDFRVGSGTLLIAAKDLNFTGIGSVHKYSLVMPGNISMATLVTEQAFTKPINTNLIHYVNDHWAVAESVISRASELGAIASVVYGQLSDTMKREIKVVHEFPFNGGNIVLAKPGLPPKLIAQLKVGLVGSNANTIIKSAKVVYPRDIAAWMDKFRFQL